MACLSKLDEGSTLTPAAKQHAYVKVNSSRKTGLSVVREKESHARLYLSGIVQCRRENSKQAAA